MGGLLTADKNNSANQYGYQYSNTGFDIDDFRKHLKKYIDTYDKFSKRVLELNSININNIDNNTLSIYLQTPLETIPSKQSRAGKTGFSSNEQIHSLVLEIRNLYNSLIEIIDELHDETDDESIKEFGNQYSQNELYKFNKECVPNAIFNDSFIVMCKLIYKQLT